MISNINTTCIFLKMDGLSLVQFIQNLVIIVNGMQSVESIYADT